MSNKIIIAKEGFDAKTETDPNNLIFSSDYETLKYYASGSLSCTIASVPAMSSRVATSSYSHNLGYFPFHVCYVCPSSSTYYPSSYVSFGSGANTFITTYVTTSQIFIYLRIENNTVSSISGLTAIGEYKIYKNNLGL